ncbi:proline-rich protein 15 [Loxodonta africana]|uniref:Proline rich 15 n=1 Tax=Loxodonta africana TaxID=9785 RepID=G3SQS9_LOXAF|nr:proline-rich protein 15 [Loxodonta africana]
MADSGDTGSSGPWWKSLMNSRKKSKEATVEAQPPAQPALGEPAPLNPDWTSSSEENLHPNLSRDADEQHKSDSRRNLKVSRSGRFKEKRNVRVTLLPEGVMPSEEADVPFDSHEEKQ